MTTNGVLLLSDHWCAKHAINTAWGFGLGAYAWQWESSHNDGAALLFESSSLAGWALRTLAWQHRRLTMVELSDECARLTVFKKERLVGVWSWGADTNPQTAESTAAAIAEADPEQIQAGPLVDAFRDQGPISPALDRAIEALSFPAVSQWLGNTATVPQGARHVNAAPFSRKRSILSAMRAFGRCGP